MEDVNGGGSGVTVNTRTGIQQYTGSWSHGHWDTSSSGGVCSVIRYTSGDSYRGAVQNSRKHGHGRYQWKDGRVYTGDFWCDERHGVGTYQWLPQQQQPTTPTASSSTMPTTADARSTTTVTSIRRTTSTYRGQFAHNQREGYGTYTSYVSSSNSTTSQQLLLQYTGHWKAGLYEGEGTLQYRNEEEEDHGTGQTTMVTLQGTFVAGRFQGCGSSSPRVTNGALLSHEGPPDQACPPTTPAPLSPPVTETSLQHQQQQQKWQVVTEMPWYDTVLGCAAIYRGLWWNDQPQGHGVATYDHQDCANDNSNNKNDYK